MDSAIRFYYKEMSTTPSQIFEPKVFTDQISRFEVYQLNDDYEKPFHVLPLGVLQIFFQLNSAVYHNTSFTDGWEERPKAFVAGPYNRGYTMIAERGVELFSLKFFPGRYKNFFSAPIDEYKNQLVPLEDIWGQDGQDLVDSVFYAAKHEQRCVLIEKFLLENYLDGKLSPIEMAIQALIRHTTSYKIEQLAEYANLSISQFRKRFVREVGLSPKEFQRVMRIGALHDHYLNTPKPSFTQLAHQFHYHDQSHFIHDFQAITGLTPKKYFS